MRFTSLTGPSLPSPMWHILQCRSGYERRLSDALRAAGVHSFYPIEKTKFSFQGKIRLSEKAAVPGYVFAKFKRQPIWHRLKARNLITGVVCKDTPFGKVPYAATQDDLRLFRGLPTVAEEAERARIEAMRVHPMDKAFVMLPGDLQLAVTVKAVGNGRVWWESDMGLKGDADVSKVRKVA